MAFERMRWSRARRDHINTCDQEVAELTFGLLFSLESCMLLAPFSCSCRRAREPTVWPWRLRAGSLMPSESPSSLLPPTRGSFLSFLSCDKQLLGRVLRGPWYLEPQMASGVPNGLRMFLRAITCVCGSGKGAIPLSPLLPLNSAAACQGCISPPSVGIQGNNESEKLPEHLDILESGQEQDNGMIYATGSKPLRPGTRAVGAVQVNFRWFSARVRSSIGDGDNYSAANRSCLRLLELRHPVPNCGIQNAQNHQQNQQLGEHGTWCLVSFEGHGQV